MVRVRSVVNLGHMQVISLFIIVVVSVVGFRFFFVFLFVAVVVDLVRIDVSICLRGSRELKSIRAIERLDLGRSPIGIVLRKPSDSPRDHVGQQAKNWGDAVEFFES